MASPKTLEYRAWQLEVERYLKKGRIYKQMPPSSRHSRKQAIVKESKC